MTNLGITLFSKALEQSPGRSSEDDVELIETHLSWVLLDGDFAWKIKKPVNLEFADFSTLEKRRHFCEEELRLNRRLAPELYLDVVPISGSTESPVLEGEGTPIEFAVKMRRFPQDRLLTEVIERHELLPRHVDELAETIARFHQQIHVASPESGFSSAESVWEPVRANFKYFDKHVDSSKRRSLLNTIQERVTRMWSELAEECAARCADGFVRECHGDLHLGNMMLIEDRVTVFDGIEFNPSFRWIDVMNEIAFVVMDMERRGSRPLAYRFLNRYCELTGDYEGVRLLPFYVAYRALIRAKVKAIRFEQQAEQHELSAKETHDFDALLQLSSRFTQNRERYLFITHGLSGSGKTTVTQSIVEQVGGIRIRSDIERKRLHHSEQLGADLYSAQATDRTYLRLEQLADHLLSTETGIPVIVDATFLKREQRDRFHRLAVERGATFRIINTVAPLDVLKSRVRERQQMGADASDADTNVIDQQCQTQELLGDDEQKLTITFSAGESYDSIIDELSSSINGSIESK